MVRRSHALLAGASLLVGCSVLTSLDGLGPSDGAPADASDAGASDAAAANLVQNASFDEGQGGCGPGWGNGYGMTFTRVSPGRTGPFACEVCVQGTTDSYQLASLQPIPVQARSYYGEAWVMTPPDGGVPPQAGVGIQLLYDVDAGISGCSGVGNVCQGTFNVPPSSSWQQTTASFVSNGTGTVTISLHAYAGTAASCFLVDDVALYAQ